MSGGFAFVWDPDQSLYRRMNREMVDVDLLDEEDVDWLRGIVTLHLEDTGSLMRALPLAFGSPLPHAPK